MVEHLYLETLQALVEVEVEVEPVLLVQTQHNPLLEWVERVPPRPFPVFLLLMLAVGVVGGILPFLDILLLAVLVAQGVAVLVVVEVRHLQR